MDRLKKLNGSMIAAIVLSVLLIMSVTAGATLAWFGSRDAASASLTMGEAIVVTVGEDYKQGEGELAMNLPVDKATGGLLPGMTVTPNVKVQLQQSNSNALLRARFITSVEYPNNYVDAAYSNVSKYSLYAGPSGTPNTVTSETAGYGRVLAPYVAATYEEGTGKLLTEATGFKDNVYAGDMYYDYYNYLGQRLKPNMVDIVSQEEQNAAEAADATDEQMLAAHTKKIHLSRVKVRDVIIDCLEKNDASKSSDGKNHSDGKYTINGVSILVTAKNAAELEIRQRGVDLTDAINRVLQGQAGYVVNPSTGKLENGGIKYTRRVADGWAYREADQAWYYLGSGTNGYVITDNTDGTSEDVNTGKPIAKDIYSYKEVTTGNVKVMQPQYIGVGDTTNPFYKAPTTQTLPDSSTITNDMNRNYLGGTKDDNSIDMVRNEIGVINQDTIASVDLSQGDVSIDFLTKKFVLPTFINNDYAKAKVTFNFTVEAVQDYLVDPLQEATAAADRLPNNLVNAILVFNNAFPQTLYPHSTIAEDKIRATGSTANILPGGGDSGKTGTGDTAVVTPKWNNDAHGTTTVTYVNTGMLQGDRYSYGFLNNSVLGVTGADPTDTKVGYTDDAKPVSGDYDGTVVVKEYVYGKDSGGTDLKIKSVIKGFGITVDEYGMFVANYKVQANYVRGTASSIGVCPQITSTWKTLTGGGSGGGTT